MEDTETARMRKYGESKMTRITMATVPHVTSSLGLRKFQADGFLLTRVYHIGSLIFLKFSKFHSYASVSIDISFPPYTGFQYCSHRRDIHFQYDSLRLRHLTCWKWIISIQDNFSIFIGLIIDVETCLKILGICKVICKTIFNNLLTWYIPCLKYWKEYITFSAASVV